MRTLLRFTCLLLLSILPVAASAAENVDLMSYLAPLADRTWIAEGKWSDGSLMKVEQRFFWGPTRRVLHFESYDVSTPQRQLLYEGMIFYDAKRGHVVQWNFKPSGDLSEYDYTSIGRDGFEARGNNTWSIVRFVKPDLLQWELRISKAEKWEKILDATYRPAP